MTALPLPAPFARKERPRVLLLEDHGEMRYALSRLMHAMGYEVTEARNLSEAYASLATHYGPYDAAVIDLQLPDGRGEDFIRDLKKLPYGRATRVVVCSATERGGHRMRAAMAAGADACHWKPIDISPPDGRGGFFEVLRGDHPGDVAIPGN